MRAARKKSKPMTCPMCGTPVRVYYGDEGTNSYEPVEKPKKKQWVLGVGYPWWSARKEHFDTVTLLKHESSPYGKTVKLKSRSGAWKKYCLILEEM